MQAREKDICVEEDTYLLFCVRKCANLRNEWLERIKTVSLHRYDISQLSYRHVIEVDVR